jgi:hypothetical protein
MLSTSCWAAGCSSGHTINAPRRNIRLGMTSGNLDFACRRAQNSDYACDLTRSRCHQEPIVIGDIAHREGHAEPSVLVGSR